MKKLWSVLALLVVFSMSLSASVAFGADGGKNEAMAMVKEAAAFYQANGLEKALDVLNDPKGKFVRDNLYVFAYDTTGTLMAYPTSHNLIGQSVIDLQDANGKKFNKEIIERVNKGEAGWAEYMWQHPKTQEKKAKMTYFEKVGDLVLLCGIFK